MIVSNLCAAKYFGKESIISVTPVIWTALIDITIVICANLIVIMMAFTSECVEPLLPFQTISHLPPHVWWNIAASDDIAGG